MPQESHVQSRPGTYTCFFMLIKYDVSRKLLHMKWEDLALKLTSLYSLATKPWWHVVLID